MTEITDRKQLEAIKTQLRIQIEAFNAEIERLTSTKKKYESELSKIHHDKRYIVQTPALFINKSKIHFESKSQPEKQ